MTTASIRSDDGPERPMVVTTSADLLAFRDRLEAAGIRVKLPGGQPEDAEPVDLDGSGLSDGVIAMRRGLRAYDDSIIQFDAAYRRLAAAPDPDPPEAA